MAQQYYEAAGQFVDEDRLPSLDVIDRRFSVAFSSISLPVGELRYGSTDTEGLWFWKRIISSVFPRLNDENLTRLTRRLYRQFTEADAWRIYPGAEEVLEWLRRHGFKLGVLTNWDTRASQLLRNLGLSAYLNEIVVSSEVGFEKPDPEIFQLVHRRMGRSADRIVMIGNDVEIDLEVPEDMGWTTLLFTPGSSDSWKRAVDEWAAVPEMILQEA